MLDSTSAELGQTPQKAGGEGLSALSSTCSSISAAPRCAVQCGGSYAAYLLLTAPALDRIANLTDLISHNLTPCAMSPGHLHRPPPAL